MNLNTFLTITFCIIDDWLAGKKLRQRGPSPKLSDSEVMTMELVGEFMGIETDKGIYEYFRTHWGDAFPMIRQVHRTTFTRQASNLWKMKELIWKEILNWIEYDPKISIIDSMPIPVCRFARATYCERFRHLASYGRDEVARQTFYGFRAHVRICYPGVIVDSMICQANIHDLHAVEPLTQNVTGFLLGDRNYWSPDLKDALSQRQLVLIAPYKSKKREKPEHQLPFWVTILRRRIETVFGQLADRYHIKRVWARDRWHFCSRWFRKMASHTLAVYIAQLIDLDSFLQFDALVTH